MQKCPQNTNEPTSASKQGSIERYYPPYGVDDKDIRGSHYPFSDCSGNTGSVAFDTAPFDWHQLKPAVHVRLVVTYGEKM